MGLTRKQMDALLPQWMEAANQAQAQQGKINQTVLAGNMDADAKLAQLIKGTELKEGVDNRAYERDLGTARDLRGEYGPETSVDAGNIRLGARDPLQALLRKKEMDKVVLTPGQIEAEKTAAKKLADFETAGGRSATEQNIKQIDEVKSDLENKKRNSWDRYVGGALSGSPALMGIFASSEKARRDKVRSTATMLARQSDPNPTQKQIDDIMGQIYDPSSSDGDIVARLEDYKSRIRGQQDQAMQAAGNLAGTGYSMPGLAGTPPRAASRSPQYSDPRMGSIYDADAYDADPGNEEDVPLNESGRQAPQAETKVINGVTYQRVQGGWKKVR